MHEVVPLRVVLHDAGNGLGPGVSTLTAVPVGDEDRPVGGGHHVTRLVQQMVGAVTRNPRLAQILFYDTLRTDFFT